MRWSGTTAHRLLATLCALFGVLFIVSTYGTLTQTYDEPFHIATGMEWLQAKRYTIEQLHPPLGRVAVAFGLYLSGNTLNNERPTWLEAWQEGNRILHTGGSYAWNLSVARLGILPFFLLATYVVWRWTRRLFGSGAALCAVLLFTTLPPILGQSGLATTDMPAAATFFAALFCFALWLEDGNATHSVILGLAVALALTSKFSNVLFLPAGMVAVALPSLFYAWGATGSARLNRWLLLRNMALAVVIALTTMGAVYRFAIAPLSPIEARPHRTIDRLAGSAGRIHDLAYTFVEAPRFPLMGMYNGLSALRAKNQSHSGGRVFVFGKLRTEPVWYYFPLVLSVKTPIPFLVLLIVGLSATLKVWDGRGWRGRAPSIAAIAFLIASIPVTIHAGVRHVLGIYPLMSIAAGYGMWTLISDQSTWHRYLAVALAVWQIGAGIYVRPDYLAYYNELVAGRPDAVLADENTDWGQDLGRLAAELKSRRVDSVALAYLGSADLSQHDLPRHLTILSPGQRVTGLVAISIGLLKGTDEYLWLEDYQPISVVGRSIWLYQIPERE